MLCCFWRSSIVQKHILGENGYSYWSIFETIDEKDYYDAIYGKKDDSLLEYSDNHDGTWTAEEISINELSESSRNYMLSMLSYEALCFNFGDYFSKFSLSSDGTYAFEGKEDEDEIVANGLILFGDTSAKIYKAIVSFEDDHLKDVTYWRSGQGDTSMTTTFTDWGSTTIDLPTNLHTHTFKEEWSSDERYHYHEGSCMHNVSSDRAYYTYDNGVVTEDGVKYTCTVCCYSFSKGAYNILFNAYGYDSYSSVKEYYSASLTVSDGRTITKKAKCINNNYYYYVTDTKGDTSKEYIYVKEDGGIYKMYVKKGTSWEKTYEKSSDALYEEDKNEWYL